MTTSPFEDSIRRLAEERRRREAAASAPPPSRGLVPDITSQPEPYSPPAPLVPSVMSQPKPYSAPAPEAEIALPKPPPDFSGAWWNKFAYGITPAYMSGKKYTEENERKHDAATTQVQAAMGGRPRMYQMERDADGNPIDPTAAPASPAPAGVPTREQMIERLVSAGEDPAVAGRSVDRELERSGPPPAALWAQQTSPDAIRTLRQRIAEGRAAEARQDAFAADFNEATGAPAPAPRPTTNFGGNDGMMAGEIRVVNGQVVHGPTPEEWVERKRAAEEAANWERRGAEMEKKKAFDDRVEAKRQSALANLTPKQRELLDYRKAVGRAWGEYKKNISAHHKQGTSFGQFLSSLGLSPSTDQPGHMAIADHYLMLEGKTAEHVALKEQRTERVRNLGMERAGNGHLAPQEILDDPSKSYEQRIAALSRLARVDPQRRHEYVEMARLLQKDREAAANAQAARDQRMFDKQPWPKNEPPKVEVQDAVGGAIANAPEGANFDTVVTNAAAQLDPELSDEERHLMAENMVTSHMWGSAARQAPPQGSWVYGKLQSLIYPADDKGTPSEKPITKQQFFRLASAHGIAPAQALAIYNYMTTGAVPGGGVPNNHAPVGVPDTDVAAVN